MRLASCTSCSALSSGDLADLLEVVLDRVGGGTGDRHLLLRLVLDVGIRDLERLGLGGVRHSSGGRCLGLDLLEVLGQVNLELGLQGRGTGELGAGGLGAQRIDVEFEVHLDVDLDLLDVGQVDHGFGVRIVLGVEVDRHVAAGLAAPFAAPFAGVAFFVVVDFAADLRGVAFFAGTSAVASSASSVAGVDAAWAFAGAVFAGAAFFVAGFFSAATDALACVVSVTTADSAGAFFVVRFAGAFTGASAPSLDSVDLAATDLFGLTSSCLSLRRPGAQPMRRSRERGSFCHASAQGRAPLLQRHMRPYLFPPAGRGKPRGAVESGQIRP